MKKTIIIFFSAILLLAAFVQFTNAWYGCSESSTVGCSDCANGQKACTYQCTGGCNTENSGACGQESPGGCSCTWQGMETCSGSGSTSSGSSSGGPASQASRIVGKIKGPDNKFYQKTGTNCPDSANSDIVKVNEGGSESTWECQTDADNKNTAFYKLSTSTGSKTVTLTPPQGLECDRWDLTYNTNGQNHAGGTGTGCIAQINVQAGDWTNHLWFYLKNPCSDTDQDGHKDSACGGDDCNDQNAAIYGRNPNSFCNCDNNDGKTQQTDDSCDGFDNNCNGQIDEGYDNDGDGFTSCATKTQRCCSLIGCTPGTGTDTRCNDCNDDSDNNGASYFPGAPERCDGNDYNCNGKIADGVDPETCQAACESGNPSVNGYTTIDEYIFRANDNKQYLVQILVHSNGYYAISRKCAVSPTESGGVNYQQCTAWSPFDLTTDNPDQQDPRVRALASHQFTENGQNYLAQSIIHTDGRRSWARKCPMSSTEPLGVRWSDPACKQWLYVDLTKENADLANPEYAALDEFKYTDSSGAGFLIQSLFHADGTRSWNRKCPMGSPGFGGVKWSNCVFDWRLVDLTAEQINVQEKKYSGLGNLQFQSSDGNKYIVQSIEHASGKTAWYRKCKMDPSQTVGVNWQDCPINWQEVPISAIGNPSPNPENYCGDGSLQADCICYPGEQKEEIPYQCNTNLCYQVQQYKCVKQRKWLNGRCCGNDFNEAVRYDKTGCNYGCCKPTQCFDSSGCIEEGATASGAICVQGQMIDKETIIRITLENYAEANTLTDYSINCGPYDQVLNSLTYPIGSQTASQYFTTSPCFKNNKQEPCAGSVCTLQTPTGTILGGSISFTPTSNDLKELTRYDQNCENAILSTAGIMGCNQNPDKLWYDNKTGIFIYSPTAITILPNWDSTMQKAAEINSSDSSYQLKKPGKYIIGSLNTTCSGGTETKKLSVNYRLSTSVCSQANAYSANSCVSNSAEGRDEVKGIQTTTPNILVSAWNSLTSMLRIT